MAEIEAARVTGGEERVAQGHGGNEPAASAGPGRGAAPLGHDRAQGAACVPGGPVLSCRAMHVEPPVRVRRTYRQRLVAPPERVFPLLCPVRECDWVEGWDPRVVYSESGLVEEDCVFITPDREREAVWLVTRYEPARFSVEFVKVLPGVTATRITIQLAPEGDGAVADITYAHTALGEEGRAFVATFTEAFYETFMKEWEGAMNHYLLKTGTKPPEAR